jgi:hypothetical protein
MGSLKIKDFLENADKKVKAEFSHPKFTSDGVIKIQRQVPQNQNGLPVSKIRKLLIEMYKNCRHLFPREFSPIPIF